MKTELYGKKQDGVFRLEGGSLKHAINRLPDGRYKIVITPFKSTRTIEQNAFYWGVLLVALSETTGYTTNEMHEYCKKKFLIPNYLEINDTITRVPASTTALNVAEFAEYLKKVEGLALGLGITIDT